MLLGNYSNSTAIMTRRLAVDSALARQGDIDKVSIAVELELNAN